MDTTAGIHALTNPNKPEVPPLENTPFFTFLVVLSSVVFPLCLMCSIAYCCRHRVEKCLEVVLYAISVIHDRPSSRTRTFYTGPCKAGRADDGHGLTGGRRKASSMSESLKGRVMDVRMKGKDVFGRIHGHRRFDDGESGEDDGDGVSAGADSLKITESNCHLYAKYGAGWTGLTPGGLLCGDKRIVDGKNDALEWCVGRDEYVRCWRRGIEQEREGNGRMTSRLDNAVVTPLPDRSGVGDCSLRESEARGHRPDTVWDVKRSHGRGVCSMDDEKYTRKSLDLTHCVGSSHQKALDGDVFDTARRVCDCDTLIDDDMAEGDGRDCIDDDLEPACFLQDKENRPALKDGGQCREQCMENTEGNAKITKSHVPRECEALSFLVSENCPSLLLLDSVVLRQAKRGDLYVAPPMNTAAVMENSCLVHNRTRNDAVGMITVSDDITRACSSSTALSVHESREADGSRHDEEKVGDGVERERPQSVALTSMNPLSLSGEQSTVTHQATPEDSRHTRHTSTSTDPNGRDGNQVGLTMTSPPPTTITTDHPVNRTITQEASPVSRASNHVTYYTTNEQDAAVNQPPTTTTTGNESPKVLQHKDTKTRSITKQEVCHDIASKQRIERNGHKINRKASTSVFDSCGANDDDVTSDQLHYDPVITTPPLAFNGRCSPGLRTPPKTVPPVKPNCLDDRDEMNYSARDSGVPFGPCYIDDGVVRSKWIPGHEDGLARQGKRVSVMTEYAWTSGRTWSPERDVPGGDLSILGVTEDAPPVYQDTTRPLTPASRDQGKPDRVTSNKRLSTTNILGFFKKASSPTHPSLDVEDVGSILEGGKTVVSGLSYDLKTVPDVDTVQCMRHEGIEKGDDVVCSVKYLNEGEGKRGGLEGCDVGDEGFKGDATRYSAVEEFVGEGQGRDKIKMNIRTHETWAGREGETAMGKREASSFCKTRDLTEVTFLVDDAKDNVKSQEMTSCDADNHEMNDNVQEYSSPNTDDIVNANVQQEVTTSDIDTVVNDTINEVTSSDIDNIVEMTLLAVMKDHQRPESETKIAGERNKLSVRLPSFLGKDTCLNDTAVTEILRPSAVCLHKDGGQVHSLPSCPKEKSLETGIQQESLGLHPEKLGCPVHEGEQRNITGPDLCLNENESESTRMCLDHDKKSVVPRLLDRRVRFADVEKEEKRSLGLRNMTRGVGGSGLGPSALRDRRGGKREPLPTRTEKEFVPNDLDPELTNDMKSRVGMGKSRTGIDGFHKQRRGTSIAHDQPEVTNNDLHIIDNTHNNVNVGIPNDDEVMSCHGRGNGATLTEQTSPFSDISSLSDYETASESFPPEANSPNKRTYRRSFKVRLSTGYSNLHETESGRRPRDRGHDGYFQDPNDSCSGLRPVLDAQHTSQHEDTTDLHRHRQGRKRKPSALVRHLAGGILHHV